MWYANNNDLGVLFLTVCKALAPVGITHSPAFGPQESVEVHALWEIVVHHLPEVDYPTICRLCEEAGLGSDPESGNTPITEELVRYHYGTLGSQREFDARLRELRQRQKEIQTGTYTVMSKDAWERIHTLAKRCKNYPTARARIRAVTAGLRDVLPEEDN